MTCQRYAGQQEPLRHVARVVIAIYHSPSVSPSPRCAQSIRALNQPYSIVLNGFFGQVTRPQSEPSLANGIEMEQLILSGGATTAEADDDEEEVEQGEEAREEMDEAVRHTPSPPTEHSMGGHVASQLPVTDDEHWEFVPSVRSTR